MSLCNEQREKAHSKRRNGETLLEFLYRSDRPEIPPICQLLEDWFQGYPLEQRQQLQRRLRSRRDDEFHSAFLELYLFTLLRKFRFDVEVPQASADEEKTEDFQIRRNRQLLCRIEATHVGQEEKHAWQDDFQEELQRSLDKAQTNGVWFFVCIEGSFDSQPRCAKVRRQFQNWHKKHRVGIVSALAGGATPTELPRFQIAEAGANITITPQGVGPASDNPVAVWSRGVRCMHTDEKLCRALNRKASRYGTMKVPFLVAASLCEMADERDFANALLGKEAFMVSVAGDSPPAPFRQPDGLWWGPKGPQNTRVSAVLLVAELFPWSVAARQPIVYHNPWAEHPLPPDILPLTQMLPDNAKGQYERCRGQPMHEILGLPEHWPRHGNP